MKNLKFLILGDDSKKKGNSFERFLKRFLRTQGYSELSNLRRTGMEIDLIGIHIITDTPLFAEAKGYNDKTIVKTKDVNAFKTKYDSYVKRKGLIECTPLFITTTDFTWEIKELNENQEEVISIVKMINGKKLVSLLRKSEWIPSLDLLNSKISEKIPFQKSRKYISIYEGNLYWLQIFKYNDEERYYAIFKNNGEIIKHLDSLKIIKLLPNFIKNLIYIDLDIQFRIIDFLLTNKETSIEDIVKEFAISKEIIELNIIFLNEYEKIIKNYNDYYSLSTEYEWFRPLIKFIFSSRENTRFELIEKLYNSNFLIEALNERLINHITTRFNIEIKNKAKTEELKKILLLFPSTLYYCLYEEDLRFFTNFPKNFRDFNFEAFKFKLYEKIIEDLFNNRRIIDKIFRNKQIFDEHILGKVMLLKNKKLHLDFTTQSFLSHMKYVGKKPLEPGSPIKLVDNKGYIGFTSSLIEFKDFKGAIKKCDEFLSDPNLEEHYYGFLINKGVALVSIGQISNAIIQYNDALVYEKEIPLLYKNLFHAWVNKYLQAINNQEDFPIYVNILIDYLISAKENLENLKSLKLSEKEIIKIGNLEDLESEINTHFNNFYENSIKNLQDVQIPNFLHYIQEKDDVYIFKIYEKNQTRIDSLIDKEFYELGHASWNILANFYKSLNKVEVAMKVIDKGMNVLKDHPDFYALFDTKAEIYYNLDDLNHSVEFYSKILEMDQDDIRVNKFYAETCWKAAKAYQALGDKDRTQDLLNKASMLVETHCKNEKIKALIKRNIDDPSFNDK